MRRQLCRGERRMKFMRRYNNSKIWFMAVLLLGLGTGCNDPDKNSGALGALSVAPLNGSNGTCPNAVVVVTFIKAMTPSTINTTTFKLAAKSAVAGVVTYDVASHAATFTPSSNLALSTRYTATVTTGARDSSGMPLAGNVVWSF